MAGRGRAAVLPAWMKAGGATPVAPGAGSASTANPAASAAAVMQAPAASMAAPQRQPTVAQPVAVDWTEHTAPDGRKYFYNAKTRQSVWTKPAELMTAEERAIAARSAAATSAGAQPQAQAQAQPQVQAQAPAPQATASEWKEYTAPDGRKYYYNATTKESRWTPPEEMQGTRAAAPAAAPGAQVKPVPAVAPAVAAAPVARAAAPVASSNGGAAAQAALRSAAKSGAFMPIPGSIQQGPTPEFATTAEARDAFKSMLADAGVSGSDNWEEVSRAVMTDKRFGVLKKHGERKAAFNEYVAQRRREEAETARMARVAAREGFFAALDDCAGLETAPRFSRARDALELDARWLAVPTPAEREELFAEWVEEREAAAREATRLARRRGQAALRDMLEAARWLEAGVSWRAAEERLRGDKVFDAVDPADALEVFREVMTELEQRDRARRAEEKQARSLRERKNRAAFRDLLADLREQGKLDARSRWADALDLVREEPAYLDVEKNTAGSRPRELFEARVEEDLLMDMEDDYKHDRSALKEWAIAHGVCVTVDTTYEEFRQVMASPKQGQEQGQEPGAFADAASIEQSDATGDDAAEEKPEKLAPTASINPELAAQIAKMPESSMQLCFEELQNQAKAEVERREKEARYRREDFARLLRYERRIEAGTTWEEAVPWLESEPEWKELESVEEKRELFDAFIAKRQAKQAERRRYDEEEGEAVDDDARDSRRHKHRKDKKRSHRDSDDDRSDKRHRRRQNKSRSRSPSERRSSGRYRSSSRQRSASHGRYRSESRE